MQSRKSGTSLKTFRHRLLTHCVNLLPQLTLVSLVKPFFELSQVCDFREKTLDMITKSFTPNKLSWSLMSAKKFSFKRVFPVLLCAGALVGTVPRLAEAQSNPGFSFIWGGKDDQPNRQLGYNLQYGTPGHNNDRWRLKFHSPEVAIAKVRITFPDYFSGKLRENKIQLREATKNRIFSFKRGKEIEVSSISYDRDNGIVEIVPLAPIPAGKKVEAVFSNVRNPRSGGMYFVNCDILSPGDIPLPRQLGTWVLSIFRS